MSTGVDPTATGFCGTCGHGRVHHAFGNDGSRCMRGDHAPATKTKPAQTGCDCTHWTDMFDTNDSRFRSASLVSGPMHEALLGVVNDDY